MLTRNELMLELLDAGEEEEISYFTGDINKALWLFNNGELDGMMISAMSDESFEAGVRDVDHNQILSFAEANSYDELQNGLDLIRLVPEGKIAMVTDKQVLSSNNAYYLHKMGYDVKVYESEA